MKLLGGLGWVVLIGLASVGCGDDDDNTGSSDFAGRYSVSITNTNNACEFDNWKIGDSLRDIQFDIKQDFGEATGELPGLANLYFLALGIGPLKGPVSNGTATLSSTGTTSIKKGASCAYFVKATASLSLTGNTINGSMTYTPVTNHSPDCGILENCSSVQTVAGSRAPK